MKVTLNTIKVKSYSDPGFRESTQEAILSSMKSFEKIGWKKLTGKDVFRYHGKKFKTSPKMKIAFVSPNEKFVAFFGFVNVMGFIDSLVICQINHTEIVNEAPKIQIPYSILYQYAILDEGVFSRPKELLTF